MEKKVPCDVLASRYARSAMIEIWDEEGKIRLERKFWISVMKGQVRQGVHIPGDAIAAYERVVYAIDLASIRRREERLQHDVMARIEEFNELAGYQYVHQGLTSRDVTDNVEQMQVRLAMKLLHQHSIALLSRFAARAAEFTLLDITGRSHLMPGQTTTLGKRFALCAEEQLRAFILLEHFLFMYPLRGIKGPMGTQQDIADLFTNPEVPDCAAGKVAEFESRLAGEIGFHKVLACTGQVYPRSLDSLAANVVLQLASASAMFAKSARLMAGHGLMHEGFAADQKGSSAMPHKRNARTCERIEGLLVVLRGYAGMLAELIGDQWLEGDVSCSVPRRVALPGMFFALDGMNESALTVLDGMQIFPHAIRRELAYFLPFLSTTRVLMAAVKKGAGREDAHAAIREHSLEALEQEHDGGPILAQRLAEDTRLGLSMEEVIHLLGATSRGLAEEQVARVCAEVAKVTSQYKEHAAYMPEKII